MKTNSSLSKSKITSPKMASFFLAASLLAGQYGFTQTCPTVGSNPDNASIANTYYTAGQGTLAVGSTAVTLNPVSAGYGTTPISIGDIILVIQMQGSQINSLQSGNYGQNALGAGNGLLSTNLKAGQMEFVFATSAVPLAGGVLTISAGTVNAYTNSIFSTDGQYTYQFIRVATYFNITLFGNINTPLWNGSVGGVSIINAVNQLDFAGFTINAMGAGFRGGAGRKLSGAAGTSKLDYRTLSTTNANGSKGEGIAGTSRYINNNGVLLDNILEGYPNGSYARGAPGNAGGGGTDSRPVNNDENSGGGGGGNGGLGGHGGNGWFSAGTTGGRGGTDFSTSIPGAVYYSPSRLIIGGGGGAGTNNDGTGVPAGGFASSGAAGGGLVIVNASSIINAGAINVSGSTGNNTVIIDGSGGGGAGGSVLIYAASGLANITVTADGGMGGSNDPGSISATQHGPGGGGGGGVIYSNATLNAATTANPGLAGISKSIFFSNNYGASGGTTGILVQNITLTQLPPNMNKCQPTIVLPVQLLEFSASFTNSNEVTVAWTTTNELTVSHYEVERSTDAVAFVPVGNTPASQSSANTHSYTLADNLSGIKATTLYYRLKMVDISGMFSYSQVVTLKRNASTDQISVYPNPASNYAVLNISSEKQSLAIVRLLDNGGREVMSRTFTINNGSNNLMIDQLNNLPKGIYMLQVIANNTLQNQKLVKQ